MPEGTFEAIKRSSFFNGIFNLCPKSENASAEILAFARLRLMYNRIATSYIFTKKNGVRLLQRTHSAG